MIKIEIIQKGKILKELKLNKKPEIEHVYTIDDVDGEIDIYWHLGDKEKSRKLIMLLKELESNIIKHG